MGLINKLDKQYTDLLQDILDNGVVKQDRTGTGTISVFGRQIRHDMKDGFPLLTTKKMPFKTIVTELLWFLRGDTNIKYLVDNNCHIWDGDVYKSYLKHNDEVDNYWIKKNPEIESRWKPYSQEEFINKIKTDDEFAKKWGELGPIYGKQWRNLGGHLSKDIERLPNGQDRRIYKKGVDQIQNLINDLKTNPDSRRLMVNAWNVGELYQMVLPPCHYGFQVYTRELSLEERCDEYIKRNPKDTNDGVLNHKWIGDNLCTHDDYDKWNIPKRAISLMWNQRSVDTFLGLPFNIASYGLLLEIIAKEVNMIPEELIGNLGDVHLYSNHIEQAKEQIGRHYTIEERVALIPEGVLSPESVEYFNLNKKTNSEINVALAKYNISPGLHTRRPFPLPTLNINPNNKMRIGGGIFTYDKIDFEIENYQSHPTIKAPLSN